MNVHVKVFETDERPNQRAAAEEPVELDILAQTGRAIAYAGVMGIGGFLGLIIGVIAAAFLGLITIGC